MNDVKLTHHRYGKSDVRLTKVIRRESIHELFECSVDISLTGAFAESYLSGDNSAIIATDSMKNAVYVVAKENAFDSPEQFALILAGHFIKAYVQVATAEATVRQAAWRRIDVNGKPHDHAFVSGGAEKAVAIARFEKSGSALVQQLCGGLTDLVVLKTTNSSFEGFVTDRFRTLPDAADRIFATSISATWKYNRPQCDFVLVNTQVRAKLLEVFATHKSRAVQETLYEMGKAVLASVAEVDDVELRMPNKHRIPINLKPFGHENANEIFVWTDEPFGEISALISRA